MKRMKKGFTLVEIMIVVAIIAILAAVAIPNFIKYRRSSQATACVSNLKQIQAAKEQVLLAGKELTQAVYRELGDERGMLSIPRFLIVDKEGKIVEPYAASPDQPDELIEQLKKVLAQ